MILLCSCPNCHLIEKSEKLFILFYARFIFRLIQNEHRILLWRLNISQVNITAMYLPVHHNVSFTVSFGDVNNVLALLSKVFKLKLIILKFEILRTLISI